MHQTLVLQLLWCFETWGGGGGGDLVECCFTSTETVGLLRAGAQDVHLDFHTARELRRGGREHVAL